MNIAELQKELDAILWDLIIHSGLGRIQRTVILDRTGWKRERPLSLHEVHNKWRTMYSLEEIKAIEQKAFKRMRGRLAKTKLPELISQAGGKEEAYQLMMHLHFALSLMQGE